MYRLTMRKLESYMDKKHPQFRDKFYINRRNKLIHVGMDKVMFEHDAYRLYLWDCESFVKANLKNVSFDFFRIPTLINSTKWKFDYIIARKVETTN